MDYSTIEEWARGTLAEIIRTHPNDFVVGVANDLLTEVDNLSTFAQGPARVQALQGALVEVRTLRDNVAREGACAVFLDRLREADVDNLCGRYLPDRPWVQWSQEASNIDLSNCPGAHEDPADYEHGHDYTSINRHLGRVWEAYNVEVQQRRGWFKHAIATLDLSNGTTHPWDDFFKDVANYSLNHDAPEEVWSHGRILECLHENYLYAHGDQVNYRHFLQYGLPYTKYTIDMDAATVFQRTLNRLSPERSLELMEAVVIEARGYYYGAINIIRDPASYPLLQPLPWVLRTLETTELMTPPWYFAPMYTVALMYNWADADDEGNVWVWCQHEEDSGVWNHVWIGQLGDDDPTLYTSLRQNHHVRDVVTRSFAAELEDEERDSDYDSDDSDLNGFSWDLEDYDLDSEADSEEDSDDSDAGWDDNDPGHF